MTGPASSPRRLYRLFLRAYPVAARRRGAQEMEELLEDLYLEVHSRQGRLAAWWLAARACVQALGQGTRARYGGSRRRRDHGRNGSWRLPLVLKSVGQDARYALRTFVASPTVTLVAIVVFALGIGANTAVFSVVEAALLRALPFAKPERLVDVTVRPAHLFERGEPGAGGGLVRISSYRAWRQRARRFDEMAVYTSTQLVLTGQGEPETVVAFPVESNLFGVLGARPLLGRGLLPQEDLPGAPRIVVLSYSFWTTRFGGARGVLGGTVTLDGEPYEIVGVMPRGFRFPTFSDPTRDRMWIPLGLHVEALAGWVVGRLQEGVTREQAKVELDGILEDLDRNGGRDSRRTGWLVSVTPLSTWVSADVRRPLLMLLGAVGLVLLVACSNVANLLLARGAAREREMSIRMAVGASARRLMGQVLVESVLLAAAGGLLGILVAYWAIPLILALGGDLIPRINDIGINAGVLGATLGGTFLAGIVAGCAPAIAAGRRARVQGLGGPGDGRRTGRITGALVVVQLALTLMLLAGAGLLLKSLIGLLQVEPGFETEHLLVAEIELPRWLYPEAEQRLAYANQVFERARGTRGVTDIALSTFAPFESGIIATVSLPDAPELDQLAMVEVSATTPEYFRVAGIRVLQGDLYDDATGGNVAVIDKAAADAYFRGKAPVGRQLATYRWRDDPLTVIGVVGNVNERSLRDEPPPHLYVPLSASPDGSLRVLARTAGDPGAAAEWLREAIRDIDPFVPIERVVLIRTLISESLQQERFYALLLGTFATTAILMAAAGVFGVMRYAVSRRTRELGIRIALGAGDTDILAMVVGRGVVLAGIGIVVGILGAVATTRLLSAFLYEVSPLDPFTFATAAAAVVGLSLGATALPAWRASRVDPIRSLRVE